MKKWIGPLSSLFLVIVLLLSGSYQILKQSGTPGETSRDLRLFQIQDQEKEESDSHYIQLLKSLQETLDGWLKSLNERIENEDVSRIEVRFLEILRSVLEWAKEKVDAKIESSGEKSPKKKERGLFRDT
jgi:hypothetical protein